MEVPPKSELPPHVQRRHKRRSTASHFDEKLEEQETTLLKAGVNPDWLQIQRVINKRYVSPMWARVMGHSPTSESKLKQVIELFMMRSVLAYCFSAVLSS